MADPQAITHVHAREVLDRHAARSDVARLEEHLFDVDVLALVLAGSLVTADDDDRRDVQPARGHELAGRRLVA